MTNADNYIPDDQEFLSMADIIRMLYRHRGKIILFMVLVCIITAAFVFSRPAGFESYVSLQIVSEAAKDGRVDKEQFETAILSHLELIQSPLVAAGVKAKLTIPEAFEELKNRVKITRPPKTSIIRILVEDRTEERALEIARLWCNESLSIVDQKNLEKAQIFVRNRIKELQDDWISFRAAAADARARAQRMQGDRLLTLERSVDDNVLWRDLTAGVSQAGAARMTNLFLKSQEINMEYLNVQQQLALVEQQEATARSMREFYQNSLDIIEARLDLKNFDASTQSQEDEQRKDARLYVNVLAKTRDIMPMGDAVVYPAKRGALKKIAIAGFGAFFAASFIAFLFEWLKRANIKG